MFNCSISARRENIKGYKGVDMEVLMCVDR